MLNQIAAQDKIACPNCSRPHDVDDRMCQHCGALLISMHTMKFDSAVLSRAERSRRIGSASLTQKKTITFEMGVEQITLPVADCVVVGRATPLPEEQPDVDLEPYLARQFGISRLHLKITRCRDLIYVTDLQSLNGTRLNGLRLQPYQERVLRSGDELTIGRLKLIVNF